MLYMLCVALVIVGAVIIVTMWYLGKLGGNRNRNRNYYHGWFEQTADMSSAPLFARSGWGYMTQEQYNKFIDDPAAAAKIRNTDSVFEFGCGVGAGLQRLRENPGIGTVGGCDLSQKSIDGARVEFPNDATRFFVRDMTSPFPEIPTDSFDHAGSFGAVGMYLTWPQMKAAVREAVRITKPGGSVFITHMIEPWRPQRGSILELIQMSKWKPFVEKIGGKNLIVRYHYGTVKSWRYFVVFTV